MSDGTPIESAAGLSEETGRLAYVTATLAGQLFGIPIREVHDVFNIAEVTPVPLAPPAILGLLNLRGRVVTAIDLRRKLGLPDGDTPARMAIGLEADRQSYCVVVDAVGEILQVPAESLEPNPIHLGPSWSALSCGVHRIDGKILVVIDVAAVLAAGPCPSSP